MSMIRKYHNHTLQTNPRHIGDELHKIHKTPGRYLSKAPSSLYPIKMITKIVSMIEKYHNHKPQTTPWHREEEPLNRHETPGRQIKQSNQLSLPPQDDCNTRIDISKNLKRSHSYVQLIMEQTQSPIMGATINVQRINNNRTSALDRPAPSLLFVWKSNLVRTSV